MVQGKFDVVIIGSGAGGAPIAHTLIQEKPDTTILMLEKGPLLLTQDQREDGVSDFKRDELYSTGAQKRVNLGAGITNNGVSYYSSHIEPDINDEPHVYRDRDGSDKATIEGYTAQAVGGGTQLYGGVSLRFTEMDFQLKTFNEGRSDLNDPTGDIKREARDWPVQYSELEPYYAKAEELVGISGSMQNQLKPFTSGNRYQTPLSPNSISSYAKTGMDALGMRSYRTPLAVITEDHAPSGRKGYNNGNNNGDSGKYDPRTGFVNRYGCPLGLKSNTWVSLLSPLMKSANFTLRPNTVVTHLEAQGDKVNKVWIRDEAGREDFVEAGLVIVACSAIESVRLLQLSAERDQNFAQRVNGNGLLGKYFLTHCFGGAEAVMPEAADKSLTVDSDWATDFCATESFIKSNGLWAGGAVYNNTSDQALPISLGRTHGSQDLDTIWSSFEADQNLKGEALMNWVLDNMGRRLSVSFMANQVPLASNRIELHPTVRDKWGRPVAHILKDWHPHDILLMDTLAEQCANVLRFSDGTGNFPIEGSGGVYMAQNGIVRIANHILGGARFGTDPADSVLDKNCRAWNFDNLYITDGSFMPTSGSANPTLTIQANSFRVAEEALLARV